MTNNEFSKLLDKKLAGVATAKDVKRLDEGLTNVKRAMATKKDFKNILTREDAKNFATKKDLERFATKKDLEAVRGDVQKVEFQLKLTEQRFGQKLEENVFRQAEFERLVERVGRLEQHVGLQPLPTVL